MKIAHYEQMMDYLTGPRESFRNGGRIGFTKKQKEIAEFLANKKGVSVDDLRGDERKLIRDGKITLESLKETKSEKNLRAGKVRKINLLNKFKPIDPDTGKVFTEKKWLSTKDFKRNEAIALAKDPVGYKQRIKKSKRKTYLNNRDKIINNVMDYYYERGGKEKAAERRNIAYKEGPLKGKAGLLQSDNNRLLKYMSVAAEFGNPKFEIYEEGGKFAGVRDTDKNIIYRDHRYKGNKGVPITAHPDYENTMDFAKTAKKFKYDRPDKLLGSYFAKYERVPTYSEMYNFFQRDPRVSERTKIQNPLELHHTATMEKYPTKSYQLALFDKNTGANKIINDYNTPGGDAFKNKALADKRLKDLNIRLKIGGEFLGGGAKTAGGALAAAKTKTTGMFKTQVTENPQLADEMAKYLGILGCGKADGGRIEFQTGATPTAQCIARGAEKINTGNIKAGAEARNASQFLNRAYKVGRGILKFGVIPEAIFVAGESLVRMGMGDTLNESLLRATDYLLPGNQSKTADKQKLVRTVGEVNADTVMRANDYKQAQQNLKDTIAKRDQNQMILDDSEFGYTSTINSRDQLALDEQKIKKAQADLKAKFQPEAVMDFATMKEAESSDIAKSKSFFPKFIQKARNAEIDSIETLAAPEKKQKSAAAPMFTIDDLAGIAISDDMLQSAKDKLGGAPEYTKRNMLDFLRQTNEGYNNAVIEAMFAEGRGSLANRERLFGTSGSFGGQPIKQKPMYDFAGGGIAKIAGKSSGPPPESGPLPQGLDFLIKRGRQS
tara:strand:+ start:600 stop:2933 length:2334 start_codon:yes stop_codon:yes gene_type:complete